MLSYAELKREFDQIQKKNRSSNETDGQISVPNKFGNNVDELQKQVDFEETGQCHDFSVVWRMR
jgi:hypothetical protein